MNGFLLIFEDRIKDFWEKYTEAEMQELFADILTYANANPQAFVKELEQVQFDPVLQPLPIVLEALSRDSDKWGEFFVNLLNTILVKAKSSANPQEMVDNLIEFAHIETHPKLFVKHVAKRLHQELTDDNLYTKSAAISMLPNYLDNPVVVDKEDIIQELQNKLRNPKWQIRYLAYISLKKFNLLPPDYSLSFTDKLLRMYKGRPLTY
ncbi:hypothetical protein DYU05_15175 [Mucilaginibacter terrenus]|uniref:HEAT repeat domain-containing protein n=1 Tax=Mucilaginibacter terrenus TaxID=2482727 RepID=A0A3E2NR38_9SPHI|nr:hypothetical protein [Mucilaginibacter terrenus]RFZ83469.1 hypothetical protein DYU05_15175 [Mucilaginibacter terrenus]